jgi:hypothetical protein
MTGMRKVLVTGCVFVAHLLGWEVLGWEAPGWEAPG